MIFVEYTGELVSCSHELVTNWVKDWNWWALKDHHDWSQSYQSSSSGEAKRLLMLFHSLVIFIPGGAGQWVSKVSLRFFRLDGILVYISPTGKSKPVSEKIWRLGFEITL